MTQNLDNYDEKYMKMKFVSDDSLPLNKTTEIPIVTIAFRTVKNIWKFWNHLWKWKKQL